MASELRFHPLVAMDLKSTMGWYDEISPSLGSRNAQSVAQATLPETAVCHVS
jgi:hypothetical protein